MENVCKNDPTVRLLTPPGQRELGREPHGAPGDNGLCDDCTKRAKQSHRNSYLRRKAKR